MKNHLKDYRKIKCYTCTDMANVIGLTKATYSKKENGSIKFSLNEAKTLADFFQMSVDELFFKEKVS